VNPRSFNSTETTSQNRVVLFTDTLADVNGVARFIRTIADTALHAGADLQVLTSTRFICPDQANIHNLPPRLARPMPAYPTLDIVWPDAGALTHLAERLNPTAVHVSTPGPVGMIGRRFARRRGLPLLGTYHTDFPAYIDHLLDDRVLTWVMTGAMRAFYRPFDRVFTRSEEYAQTLVNLGVERSRIVRLIPGIDTSAFDARRRDPSGHVWDALPGARRASLKALYVGRVSVEKNLLLLTKVWPHVRVACRSAGVDAQLIIVGDGPYRDTMARELAGTDAVFAGFRHGVELATIYASSTVFVFPSTTDTLGQVVMEAQCAGLPVLVTDQGGPPSVVDHDQTGRVLPAHRPELWTDAMTQLLTQQALAQTMGERARAKMAGMTIQRSFDHWWTTHLEAIRRRSGQPGKTG
jgi:glycosyltransferase involved in cell wall biosynthesis